MDPASIDGDYHVVSEETYRLEFSFLLKDGTVSVTPPAAGTGVQNISAVIVALGVLDNTSRAMLKTNTSNPSVIDQAVTGQMIGALPEANSTQTIAQTWNASNYLTASGIPQTAASQIRIYQRHFYLHAR